MKKNYLLFFLPVALLGLMLSCKSAPAAPASPPKETSQPSLDLTALDDAASRAEAARKRAMDFDTPEYFPSEWGEAEAQFTEAGNAPRDTEENAENAVTLYNAAAASYDGLFEKAVPLYAQAREDEIMAARSELLASTFVLHFPEYLDSADTVALEAREQYESKDYYAAKDTAGKALENYQILNSGAAAYLTRQEILNREFKDYDPENFEKADAAGMNAFEAWDAGNTKSARDSADEAQLRYNLVLNNAWAVFVAEKRSSAGAERQKALDVKANVAIRNAFNEADSMYTQASSSLEAEKFTEAAVLFEKSAASFAELTAMTEEKRALAETAIREAEERTVASDEAARRAEEIIEGDAR